MRKQYFLLLLAAVAFYSCTKKNTTTVNTTVKAPPSQPAFVVEGMKDITFTNTVYTQYTLTLSATYQDSAQESVTFSLSGLPQGVQIDTNWINAGIPTFNTSLTLYDTLGAAPGTYSVELLATTSTGSVRHYPFKIRIQPMPTAFLGRYDSCLKYCPSAATYVDSVYLDASDNAKIWFVNFANTGTRVYGRLSGANSQFTIPSQTAGGSTVTGTGQFSGHFINVSLSTSCALNMY